MGNTESIFKPFANTVHTEQLKPVDANHAHISNKEYHKLATMNPPEECPMHKAPAAVSTSCLVELVLKIK